MLEVFKRCGKAKAIAEMPATRKVKQNRGTMPPNDMYFNFYKISPSILLVVLLLCEAFQRLHCKHACRQL